MNQNQQSAQDNWELINSIPDEEYAKKLAHETKRINELIQQLDFSSNLKLPRTKKMLHNIVCDFETVKNHLASLIQFNKDSETKVSDLIH